MKIKYNVCRKVTRPVYKRLMKKEREVHINLTTSLKPIHTPLIKKNPILTLPLSTRLLSNPKLLLLFVMNDKR